MGDKNSTEKKMDKLMDASLEFRMQAKQMEKEAVRAQKNAEQQKAKAKTYMDKGDMESAKVIAGEAIRYQHESTNLHKMSGKMSAVSAKLDSAVRSTQVSEQIKNAVPSMTKALKTLNSAGMNKNMADFEKVFEDLDVKTADLNGALESSVGVQDSEAVTNLLAEMQGQNALAAQGEMVNVNQAKIEVPEEAKEEVKNDEIGDMERRLAALR